ncbi:MAG: electron transport complex subunit RsxC [Clostridia bacterium]|nr:electron transport complex subunit RsxC [Clostridia bacterium]
MPATFKGGLHIEDFKDFTNKLPIKKLSDCGQHIFPLQQHIGAPLEAVVKVGDYVKVGQKIADSSAFVCAPLHSSVSGTVTDIKPFIHPSGAVVTSIAIENDFLYNISESVIPKGDPTNYTPEQIIAIIRDAGIVGLGGAGFPTHVKLSPPPDKKITHVIVNGAECEPYLTSDHRRMLESPDMILYGLKIAMRVLGLSNGYIGIETNKADAIKTMTAAADAYKGVKIIPLKTKYPQGAEKQLIKAITKRSVPSKGLPADVGVIVLNIDTVTAIANVFKTGMPLTSRIVTVSGDCVKEPGNFEVPLGVPFRHIFENAGGFMKEPRKIIMGGPMMGIAQFSLDAPSIKTTSALLALSDVGKTYDDISPCIRCGKCVNSCPMHLMPLYLNKAVSEGDLETAEKYNILDCIECGICSYLCPGRQNPLQHIRVAKQQIIEKSRKS